MKKRPLYIRIMKIFILVVMAIRVLADMIFFTVEKMNKAPGTNHKI